MVKRLGRLRNRTQRESSPTTGFTVWLTGLSGAGKSTLASAMAMRLSDHGRQVEVLDGDHIREVLSPSLGFSQADRLTQTRRIGYLADLLSRNGVAVIVSSISPYAQGRNDVRRMHRAPFFEVYVDCSLPTLRRRDTKGLYAAEALGTLRQLTGVSDPYEAPSNPDAHIRTDVLSIEDCIRVISDLLIRNGHLKNGLTPPSTFLKAPTQMHARQRP